jgi:hypothetical protein
MHIVIQREQVNNHIAATSLRMIIAESRLRGVFAASFRGELGVFLKLFPAVGARWASGRVGHGL